MTDRIKGFTVVLDNDYREDDVEAIRQAIQMVKGVLEVTPVLTSPDDYMNRARVSDELRSKLIDVLVLKRT